MSRSAAWLYSDLGAPVSQAQSTAIPPWGLRFRVWMAQMHIDEEYTSQDCAWSSRGTFTVTLRSRHGNHPQMTRMAQISWLVWLRRTRGDRGVAKPRRARREAAR